MGVCVFFNKNKKVQHIYIIKHTITRIYGFSLSFVSRNFVLQLGKKIFERTFSKKNLLFFFIIHQDISKTKKKENFLKTTSKSNAVVEQQKKNNKIVHVKYSFI